VVVRWFAAILLIGGLVAGLFAVWPSGSQQGIQLIPTDITIHTPGVSPRQLTVCQQDWERWGGLSSGQVSVLGGPQTSETFSFLQAADRLAEADNTGQTERVFEIAPILSDYVKACQSLLDQWYQRT
jgi:hypothetical protein